MTLWIATVIFLLILFGFMPTLIRRKKFELNFSFIIFFTAILFLFYVLFIKILPHHF